MDKIERAQESASKEAEELKGKVSEEASQVSAKVEALQKNQEELHAKLEEILGALGGRRQPEPSRSRSRSKPRICGSVECRGVLWLRLDAHSARRTEPAAF